MIPTCKKCGSTRIIIDGEFAACLACSERQLMGTENQLPNRGISGLPPSCIKPVDKPVEMEMFIVIRNKAEFGTLQCRYCKAKINPHQAVCASPECQLKRKKENSQRSKLQVLEKKKKKSGSDTDGFYHKTCINPACQKHFKTIWIKQQICGELECKKYLLKISRAKRSYHEQKKEMSV